VYSKILRLLAPLTGAMILVSAGWTAFNTIALIGTRNPLSYGVALLFDAAWLVAVAVQHEMRYRVDLRVRLSAIGWALTALSAGINAASELLGHHGLAVAVVAALVPPLAKGSLALKLFTEANSPDAKSRFTSLVQSWSDQTTELRITEAMAAGWHKVERAHENRDAERLAVTQQDRLANLELTSGAELPITRTADPVVWEPPASLPLAPVFREPEAPQQATETVSDTSVRPVMAFGFAPAVTGATSGQSEQADPTVARLSPTVPPALAEHTEANRRRRADALAYMGDNPGATPADVAERFGVSLRTVQRWLQQAQS
jgi:hypothetical protein